MLRPLLLLLVLGLVAGCPARDLGPDKPADASPVTVAADAHGPECTGSSPDLEGCQCAPGSAARACYPSTLDPATRHMGACKDGSQECVVRGEFATYGPCAGATGPVAEVCHNGADDNCDGRVDCADPSCATATGCDMGCTNGQTRACYTGPQGTENVGTCRPGTQVCANNKWPTNCPGQVLPAAEDCAGPTDKNCNHLPGCFDFSCFTAPACTGGCKSPLDPGCVCPMGTGDVATCPEGTHGVESMNGFNPPTYECCPCTANDCGDAGCCAETVCLNDAKCHGLTCKPLPPSCNGMVNMDCDDFPEDCDEPCCKCSTCQ